jgi:hypothetical protein
MVLNPYALADEAAVIDLWKRCDLTRSWNDPRKDIQRKLGEQPELFLVRKIDGVLVATVMAGFDGHRGGLTTWRWLPRMPRRWSSTARSATQPTM